MALEHSIIVKGIQEELKENRTEDMWQNTSCPIQIMQGDTDEIKLLNAQRIPIKSCRD